MTRTLKIRMKNRKKANKILSHANMFKIFAGFVHFMLATAFASAQNYDEPTAVKWNRIETSHFKIVYPRETDSTAQRYANILEKAYGHVSRSLNSYYKKTVPLVLHNSDLNSNAWVSFAPRQMNFMTAPINHLYVTPWDKSLALHEFRHYVQISKYSSQGILKFASYLFGDYASVAWAGIVPDWFFEGDATLSETSMSNSGRGRMPFFLAEYRAYLLSDKNFSYDKWLHGSYKDFIPNAYAYGYVQTAYARKRFGADVWEKTLTRAQAKSIPFFGRGFRKVTKTSLKELQRESFEYLKNSWETENRQNDENVKYITDDEKNYTKYLYPYFIGNDSIVAVKHNLKNIPSLVVIEGNAGEKHLADIGYYSDRIYFDSNRIYWIENIRDVRWTAKSSNTVRFYDLNSGRIKTALTHTRYRALAFGNNAETLAAAEYTADDKNFICILDKNRFTETCRIQTPDNATVVSLAVSEHGNIVAASLLSDAGMSLQTLDPANGKWDILIDSLFTDIANISFYAENIIFNSGFDGVDNLYLISTKTRKTHRLTNSKFGTVAASHNKNGYLTCSEYYSNGLRLAIRKIAFDKNASVDLMQPYKFELAEVVAAQENFVIDTIDLKNVKTYSTKSYGKTANLFRVRNWLPFYAGINPEKTIASFYDSDDDDKLSLGATVVSQNLLGNATARLAYSYRSGYSAVHAGFTYTGWFPVISIEGHYGGGKNFLINGGNTGIGNENKFNMEAAMYIPFVFSNSRHVRGITPVIQFSVSNSKYFAPAHLSMCRANLAEYGINAYAYRQLSKADIFPKWGLIFNLQFKNSPFDTENFGNIYGGKFTAYIPGLFANHGFRLSASHQQQDIKRYIYSVIYDFPRETNNNLASKKLNMLSADYAFPVAYPDVNLGALAYITRIRANLFYDFAVTKNLNGSKSNIYAFGADILFDAYWFRMDYPVTLGFRLYKTNPENNTGIRLMAAISF
ncbi:MAG: hypothetical protein LBK94_10530 [Prevotellaceae bacterium]|jgi:hypothetical protein|nr:hypothetical protein [Prevotellaceae bacterium]